MKEINIGGMRFDMPESNARITELLNNLTDLQESGKLRSIFVTFTTNDKHSGSAMLGDFVTFPYLCLMADAISERVVESMTGDFTSHEEDDDD